MPDELEILLANCERPDGPEHVADALERLTNPTPEDERIAANVKDLMTRAGVPPKDDD